jgi:hypothetical protein
MLDNFSVSINSGGMSMTVVLFCRMMMNYLKNFTLFFQNSLKISTHNILSLKIPKILILQKNHPQKSPHKLWTSKSYVGWTHDTLTRERAENIGNISLSFHKNRSLHLHYLLTSSTITQQSRSERA